MFSVEVYKKKREEAMDFWVRVATDLNAGMRPVEIARRYINPKTGKNYTREHIYWVIGQIEKFEIEPKKKKFIFF